MQAATGSRIKPEEVSEVSARRIARIMYLIELEKRGISANAIGITELGRRLGGVSRHSIYRDLSLLEQAKMFFEEYKEKLPTK